jgi:hypothetical protein
MKRIAVAETLALSLVVLLGAVAIPAQASNLSGEFLTSQGSGGTTTVSGSCNPTGTSTINFSATGAANGPFPGTFTESGTVTIGAQGGTYPPGYYDGAKKGQIESFNSTFRIDSPSGVVTGTKTLDQGSPSEYQGGTCNSNTKFARLDVLCYRAKGPTFEEFGRSGNTEVSQGGPSGTYFQEDYHIQGCTIVQPGGLGNQGPGGSGSPAAASGLAFSNQAFAAESSGPSATSGRKKAPRGTGVSFKLSEAASVRFTVTRRARGRKARRGKKTVCARPNKKNRKRKRCTRVVTLKGSFSRNGVAGTNSFHFTGRLNGRKLKPGRYRLVATPTAAGKKGKPTSRQFRIVR